MDFICVTGTNGKTSTTFYIRHLLGGEKIGVIGTLGAFVGDKEVEYSGPRLTTPDGKQLCEIISKMKKLRVKTIVMEASAHGIVQGRMNGIKYRVGVFTNLTQDHLDYFKNMESYAKVKTDFMCSDQIENAVVNTDDIYGRKIFASRDNVRAYHVGKNFTESNANAAVEVAKIMGVGERKIQKRLKTMPQIAGRFQTLTLPSGATVIIDYAHTPDGLEKVLTAARAITKYRLFVVFGCGGNRDTAKRPIMGQIAVELADYVVVTSDNPRNENAIEIMNQIGVGVKIIDRETAIKHALDMAKAGDVVVIAGKGAEDYMEIKGVKYPYNDLSVVKNYIRGKK